VAQLKTGRVNQTKAYQVVAKYKQTVRMATVDGDQQNANKFNTL
jgi:hypothetical protein